MWSRYLRMEAIEMDFFGSYLRNYPTQALASQDQVFQSRINSLREQIRVCDRQLADAAELIAQVPVKELADKMRKLNDEKMCRAGRTREAAQTELPNERGSNGVAGCSEHVQSHKWQNYHELNAASEELRKELADPDIRRGYAS